MIGRGLKYVNVQLVFWHHSRGRTYRMALTILGLSRSDLSPRATVGARLARNSTFQD